MVNFRWPHRFNLAEVTQAGCLLGYFAAAVTQARIIIGSEMAIIKSTSPAIRWQGECLPRLQQLAHP